MYFFFSATVAATVTLYTLCRYDCCVLCVLLLLLMAIIIILQNCARVAQGLVCVCVSLLIRTTSATATQAAHTTGYKTRVEYVVENLTVLEYGWKWLRAREQGKKT